jgi:hypothetical protein
MLSIPTCCSGKHVLWHAKTGGSGIGKKRSVHPNIFFTNSDSVVWVTDVDTRGIRCLDNNTILDVHGTSEYVRQRFTELDAHLRRTESAVLAPFVRIQGFVWASRQDWLSEQSVKLTTFSMDRLDGWDVMIVDIVFAGKTFKNRPWQCNNK